MIHTRSLYLPWQASFHQSLQPLGWSASFMEAGREQEAAMPRKFALSNQQSPSCRGPHENYVDRCDSAHPRLYTSAVPALHTPYIAPAENGGREGARWLALCPEVWAPMPCLLPVLLLHC